VVELALQPCDPHRVVPAPQLLPCLSCEGCAPIEVRTARIGRRSAGLETLRAVLPDRLEHSVAGLCFFVVRDEQGAAYQTVDVIEHLDRARVPRSAHSRGGL